MHRLVRHLPRNHSKNLMKLLNLQRDMCHLQISTSTRRDPICPIAIVGMACRYPGANSIKEFWDLLEQGLDGIRKAPEGRWTQKNSIIRVENVRNTQAGFLSCPIDTFDAKFFR